ncbi:MAG: radical SAM protein [Proteobacteria bacterium]|nr:radical SAM protein [Pseudomonadota bacterium]MCP4921329.1 radical SAM protein [Pseudomonadota bacterium]
MTERTLDFADHRRKLGENRYVYPVVSRRSKGLSIGVNLNPDTVCNFDCPYCQVDRLTPPRWKTVDLQVLHDELDSLLTLCTSGHLWETAPFDTTAEPLRRVNDVAFAGDGEPTSFSGFPDAVALVGQLLRRHDLSGVRPIVLTNATLLQRPRVREGLRALDALDGRVWAKLDAGTEPYFQFVDGTSLPFERVLKNLEWCASERPLVIQAMFLRLWDLGPSDEEVAAWLACLQRIAAAGTIELVQVYSIARHPARPVLQHLPVAELELIADGVRSLGLNAEVYAGRPT